MKKTNPQLELAKRLCAKEGLKKQVNIAQMCEVLRCLREELESFSTTLTLEALGADDIRVGSVMDLEMGELKLVTFLIRNRYFDDTWEGSFGGRFKWPTKPKSKSEVKRLAIQKAKNK